MVRLIRRATAHIQIPDTRVTLLALAEITRRAQASASAVGANGDLSRYELRVFSQNGEDGVIAEVLRRIGRSSGYFVEFGVGAGVEGNCVLLADAFGWSGLFMDANPRLADELRRKYPGSGRVTTRRAIVRPDNVEALFAEADVVAEPDVLSIDIDGGDYYIWEAIESYRPRVVIIEYNSALDPTRRLVQPRDRGAWDRTTFFGASLGALEALGERKGYVLVHTDLSGNNAFFVRRELAGSFPDPASVPRRASNFYLLGLTHLPDRGRRRFVDLDAG
ncbi:MAG: hypothetical protein QOI64_1401 [Solirubrobacteraceae bacterium]|nr:hypothetical protein [Solirubrobacteraceae bacterium]